MQIFTIDNNDDVVKKLADEFNVDLSGIQFQCRYYETRNSWGHKAEAIDTRTGEIISNNRIRYYNRTWERYTFETILRELVRKTIKVLKKRNEV